MKKIIIALTLTTLTSAALAQESYYINETTEYSQVINPSNYFEEGMSEVLNAEGKKIADKAILRLVKEYRYLCDKTNGEGSFDFGSADAKLSPNTGILEVTVTGVCH